MLRCRSISAVVLILIVIIFLFKRNDGFFSFIVLQVVCALATWEWSRLSRLSSFIDKVCFSSFCCLLLIVVHYVFPMLNLNTQSIFLYSILWISGVWWISALVLLSIYPCSVTIWSGSCKLTLAAGIFSVMPFLWVVEILKTYKPDIMHVSGKLWLTYIFIVVCATDIFSYFFGKLIGQHQIATKISPGKTWEGLLGGILSAVAISYLYSMYIEVQIRTNILIEFSIFISLVSLLGDLTESMFKRIIGTKDSSHLIPGHGGILDRIDSLMAATPVFFLLIIEMS